MTTRETTGVLSRADVLGHRPWTEKALVLAWGGIQWPWLLRSLDGGRKRDKRALLDRLELPRDALPNLGSWKADTRFLTHIVDTIERDGPSQVVELGCGASSLVIARALEMFGGGRLVSFDQNADFAQATAAWLTDHGLEADIRHAPLVPDASRWSSSWYGLSGVPDSIDLLVIDGPPWALSPFGRGRAEVLFDRITPGGAVLLDDAARPGERIVASRWRKSWPEFSFVYDRSGAKGTLIGRRNQQASAILT
jgi:predicted O-methyltransferase YrrM